MFWNNVLFAEKSKFNIFGSDGCTIVWRRRNEQLSFTNLVGRVQHGGISVLIWGLMSITKLGNLAFTDGIMNHSLYLNILWDNLK